MVKIGDFKFSLTEFAGALGDFGPLNPFLIGYIALLGLDPFGIFFAMGFTNIILGYVYRLPLLVGAKKVIGTYALEERWSPTQIYLSGILTGLVWLSLSFSKLIGRRAKATPISVIRGIQLGLMIILLKESLELMWTNVPLAIASILIVILLLRNKVLPGAIAVFLLGLILAFLSNPNLNIRLGLHSPQLYFPSVSDMSFGLMYVVVVQLVLTFSNAVLATRLAVNERFRGRKIRDENLAMNMGWINTVFFFFGSAPLCHGSGGFAQYFFGAHTGGAMIMESITELILVFLLADSVATVFVSFPHAIIGTMLLFASVENPL